MVEGEQATTGDVPKDTATPEDATSPKPTEPISLYDKTEAIVKRQEEANIKTEELLKQQQILLSNQKLAGTAGGHVPTKPAAEETPKEYRDRIDKEMTEGKHLD